MYWRARRDLNPGPFPKMAPKPYLSGDFPRVHTPTGKSLTNAQTALPMLYLIAPDFLRIWLSYGPYYSSKMRS